jgi:hypothetical protein
VGSEMCIRDRSEALLVSYSDFKKSAKSPVFAVFSHFLTEFCDLLGQTLINLQPGIIAID